MIQLTVLYGQPQDPAAFDRYYREVHAPLAKKLSGLKGYTSNKPTSLNQQEPSPYYLIDTLYFENREALQAIFQSPEGQAVAADLPNVATGGATVVVGEIEVYDPVALS